MKPLLSIWTSPVKTFEFLSKRDDSTNRTMVNILSAMITIGAVFPQLKDLSEPFGNNKIIGILIGITLSGLIGIIIVRFLLVLIYWAIGRILKGEASKKQIQLVVAYSLTPYLIYLGIGLILIIPALITKNLDLVFYHHPVTYVVVWILSARNLIYGLSYFNKYSYGYALLNILIPAGIFELIKLVIN